MHLTRIEIGCRARINIINRRDYKFIESYRKLKLVVQMVASCTRCSMEPNPSGIVVMWWIGGLEPERYSKPLPMASSLLCKLVAKDNPETNPQFCTFRFVRPPYLTGSQVSLLVFTGPIALYEPKTTSLVMI